MTIKHPLLAFFIKKKTFAKYKQQSIQMYTLKAKKKKRKKEQEKQVTKAVVINRYKNGRSEGKIIVNG